ncbi:zinc finger, CCHC-type containing protein, partial [Tanacetum coccineum]
MVIQGFRQKSGIDYFDTYAPVARIRTIRLLIAMASIQNLIIQMDVKTAFLNGELDEEISNTEDNSSTNVWVFLLGGAAGKEPKWLRNLNLEIPLLSKPIAPISIRCDSSATLAKAYSQIYNGNSRHLGVRHNMIQRYHWALSRFNQIIAWPCPK